MQHIKPFWVTSPPSFSHLYPAAHTQLSTQPYYSPIPHLLSPREASPSNLQLCCEPAACPQPQLTTFCPAPILDLSRTGFPALRSGPLAFSHPAEIPLEIHVLTACFLQPVLRLGTQPHLTTYLPAMVPLRFCLICLLFQSNTSFCIYLLVFSSASKQSHSCALKDPSDCPTTNSSKAYPFPPSEPSQLSPMISQEP